jgi:hypothetical protein
MSINFIKDNIFGAPISSGSVLQFNKRKEIVSKRVERSVDDVYYLTSNTAWVRITSGVDIQGDSNPAKKYQLFKGIAPNNGGFTPTDDPETSSYSDSIEYGYVPIPGLTNFEVQTKGDYGSLRLANFSFTVNSPDDFSKLEQLYLRPGYVLMLEWGHSVIVTNDGRLDTAIKYYDTDTFLSPQDFEQIKTRIVKLREINRFNYDGMVGLIRNFSWTYNGQNYICSVDVVAGGELVESILNNNAPLIETEDEDTGDEYSAENFSSDIERILSTIKTTPVKNLSSKPDSENFNPQALEKVKLELNSKLKKYESATAKLRILTGTLAGESNDTSSSWTKYIRLRDFLNFINEGCLLYDKNGKNILRFFTDESSILPFTTYPGHIGLDPDVCILPKKNIQEDFNIPFAGQVTDLEETDLLNIFINVEYLRTTFIQFSKSANQSDNSILNVIKSILDDITSNLGYVNSFSIIYEDDKDTFHIVDTTVTPSRDSFEISDTGEPKAYIDLVGLKSEVLNLKVESALSSEFSTMIAIAASNSEDTAGAENVLNMKDWNEGLSNRHLTEITTGTTKTTEDGNLKKINENTDKYKEFLKSVSHGNLFYLSYDKSKFTGYRNIHKMITRKTIKEIVREKGINAPGLIPIRLSFTIKGISGIKILQTFKINEFFLPDRYKNRSAFIIDGLDHKIENGMWVTEISAYFYPI